MNRYLALNIGVWRHRSRRVALAVAVAAAAAALTSAGVARGAWSQVTVIGTGVSQLPVVQAAGNAGGTAVVVWTDRGLVYAATRSAKGGWGSAVSLSSSSETASAAAVTVRSDCTAVALWSATRGSNGIVESSILSGGAWSVPALVSGSGENATTSPAIAVDGSGQVRAVWVQNDSTGSAVATATLSAQGGWSAPQILETINPLAQPIVSATLAVNPSGAAVVGWMTGRATFPHTGQVATRPAGGAFSAPVQLVYTVGRPIQDALNSFQVAIDASGRATAAWSQGYGGAWAASQATNGAWGSSVRLAATSDYRMSLAVGADGTALASWSDPVGLESASRPPSGSWTTPVIVSAGAVPYPAGPALAANGSTIYAVWDDLAPSPRQVAAGSWTPASGWSTPTNLDTLASQYGYTTTSAAALGSGAVAAWTNATSTQSRISVSVFTP
jgi:hypothetical protein